MGVPIKPGATKKIKMDPPTRRVQLSTSSKIFVLLLGIIGICLIVATIVVVIRAKDTTSPKSPPSIVGTTTEIYSQTFILIISDNDTEKNPTLKETDLTSEKIDNYTEKNTTLKEPDLTSEKIATTLLSFINVSVNPCDDFCKFTGGEGQALDLRNHQASTRATRKLRGIFAEESPADEPKSLTYVRNLYRACVKQDPTTAPDWDTLREILKLLGGWPVIEGDSWPAENVSWRDIQVKLSRMHYEGFFKTSLDYFERPAMMLAPIGRIFPDENNSKVTFKQKLVNMAGEMGAERDRTEKQIEQALNFDQNLTQFQYNSLEFELRNLQFLQTSLGIPATEVMSLFPLHFNVEQKTTKFPEKNDFIIFLNETSTEVVFNHALMRLIIDLTSFSSDPLEREEQCVNFTSDRFLEAQEILYVRKYFHKNTKQLITEVVQNLKNSLKEQFEEFKNEPSNQIHQNHNYSSIIDNVSLSLGYPDEFFDDEKITEYYKNLEIYPENFLQGFLNYTRYKLNFKDTVSFDFQRNLSEYTMPSREMSLSQKDRYIPAEYLYTYFVENVPKYTIYGEFVPMLGAMINSEYTYLKHDLELDSDLKHDLELDSDLKHDLELDSDLKHDLESDSDIWNIKGAYSMYKNWLNTNGHDWKNTAPANYTNEQMFWISWSYLRCEKNIVDSSPLNRPISAYENFQSDFNCTERKKS